MKEKKSYLKVACLLELIYLVISLIYSIFYIKNTEEVIANVFMILISFKILTMMYSESKKTIKELKQNRIKLIICSIWMFMDCIVPGVLGFIFLKQFSTKKDFKLPVVKENKKTLKSYVNSILTILIFVFIMFVLPLIKVFEYIPTYIIYIAILLFTLFLNYKDLKEQFILFIKNLKAYIPFIIKRYFIMLGIMFLVAIPIVIINGGEVAENQQVLNELFKVSPIFMLLLTVLYAPLVEESVFRLSIGKLINNKVLFIVVSGFLFGLMHVIDDFNTIKDFLYVFQYSALGCCLAKAYYDSKNIFVSISMHFIQNFLAAILILILYL